MLTKIMEKVGSNRNLKTVSCDFEMSMINSLRSIIGTNIDIRGCSFHFRKAIWKNIGDCGLQPFFYDNETFNELVYKIYALSFVPKVDVAKFYQVLVVDVIEAKLDTDENWQ